MITAEQPRSSVSHLLAQALRVVCEEPATAGQRVARTTIQTALAAMIGLVLILPSVIDFIDEEVGDHLPPNSRLWTLGVAGTTPVLSGLAARVMAIPAVNAWLARWTGLGTLRNE